MLFTHTALRTARAAIRGSATIIGPHLDRRVRRISCALTRGLTVFIFHEVTEEPSEFQRLTATATEVRRFISQVKWISQRFNLIEPTQLPQLTGIYALPPRAGLITFDDSWAGISRTALPILKSLGIPSLWFLNMSTVDGAPDLSAVRQYEALHPPSSGPTLERPVQAASARDVLLTVDRLYHDDEAFREFQGPMVTARELEDLAASGAHVWLGSHLFHHWDLLNISPDVFVEAVKSNARALARYGNSLPVLATPHGRLTGYVPEMAADLGLRAIFSGSGRQNDSGASLLLDRVALEPWSSTSSDWWYATHRRRLFGNLGVPSEIRDKAQGNRRGATLASRSVVR